MVSAPFSNEAFEFIGTEAELEMTMDFMEWDYQTAHRVLN